MLYYALGILVAALLLLVLGFTGVVRGAAGIVSIGFLLGLVLLVAGTMAEARRQRLHR